MPSASSRFALIYTKSIAACSGAVCFSSLQFAVEVCKSVTFALTLQFQRVLQFLAHVEEGDIDGAIEQVIMCYLLMHHAVLLF